MQLSLSGKLAKRLYHGTSRAAAILVISRDGLNPPVHLVEDKERAIHYARAATAYLEHLHSKAGTRPLRKGCAVLTFNSVPSEEQLVVDDYNEQAEPGQWKYLRRIRGLRHFSIEYFPLEASEEAYGASLSACGGTDGCS